MLNRLRDPSGALAFPPVEPAIAKAPLIFTEAELPGGAQSSFTTQLMIWPPSGNAQRSDTLSLNIPPALIPTKSIEGREAIS